MVQAKVQQSILGLIHRYRRHNCLCHNNGHLLGVQERSVLQLIFKKVAEGGDCSQCGIHFGISTCRAAGGFADLVVKKFTVKDVNCGAPLTSVVSVVYHLGLVRRKSVESQVSEHALEANHHGSSLLPG
jgi:hypothetical protein